MKSILFSIVLFMSAGVQAQTTDLDMQKHKGKVVYLDFWASWCGPCKESFPWLNSLKKKFPNLVVIGINLDKEKADAEKFLKEHPAQFPIVYNPAGQLAEKFGVKGMPYSVIFNKKGGKAFSHIGFNKEKAKEYEKQIKTLLGAK